MRELSEKDIQALIQKFRSTYRSLLQLNREMSQEEAFEICVEKYVPRVNVEKMLRMMCLDKNTAS